MDDSLKTAVRRLGMVKGQESGLYAPLAKRYPLYIDDAVPQGVKHNLESHQTCACADKGAVYIDTSMAQKMFERARENVLERKGVKAPIKGVKVPINIEQDNYVTLLVHEYTHLLMRHVDKGVKFIRANGDKYYPIFAYACDIEANRGYMIQPESDIYQIAVTDESFPKCKGVLGLMNIYRTMKKYYGNEIMEEYEKLQLEEEEENEGAGSENKSKSESKSESEDEAKSGSSGSSSSDEKSESGKTEAEKERAKRVRNNADEVKRLREQIRTREATMTEEEKRENEDKYKDTPNEGAIGTGEAEGDDVEGLLDSPHDLLNTQAEIEAKKKFQKVLDKLKGVVKGEGATARVKTYSRQSRKASEDGLIRKGTKNAKPLVPKVLVAMDSSGSMSYEAVTPIAQSIGTLAQMLGQTRGSWICEHDAHVKNVLPLSQWEKVVNCYRPDGDNDFDEVLAKALELKVDVVMNIGDGYSGLRDKGLMKRAKQAGIKWFDVQVCGNEKTLREIIKYDEGIHGEDYIGRTILKTESVYSS